ncbi:calcium-binding protein, partial [Roseofilum sp. BLCC_M91]
MATYTGANFDEVTTSLKEFSNQLSSVLNPDALSSLSADIPLIQIDKLTESINNDFINPFNNALNQVSSTVNNVNDFIAKINSDLAGLGNVTLLDEKTDSVSFKINLDQNIDIASPLSFDSILPGLGIKIDGGEDAVQGSLDLNLDFGVELFNDREVQLKFDGIDDLQLGGEIKLNDELSLGADIGFLSFDATNNGTQFNADLDIDLDKNGDGKLELSNNDTSAKLDGGLDVNLGLKTQVFGSGMQLPSIESNFVVDWDLGDAKPDKVAFENTQLDAGKFLSDFINPVLQPVNQLLDPIKPVIDALQKEVSLLTTLSNNLGGVLDVNGDQKVNLMDLLQADLPFLKGDLDPDFIDNVTTLVNLIDKVPSGSEIENLTIDIGSYELQDFISDNREFTIDTQAINPGVEVRGFQDQISSQNKVSTFFSSLDDIGFEIPVLDNPTTLFNLFLGEQGKDIDFVKYTSPTLSGGFEITKEIPIVWPLSVFLKGTASFDGQISLGFDSYGIKKLFSEYDSLENAPDVSKSLLEGFYIDDANDIPIFQANLGVEATGGVDVEVEVAGFEIAGVEIKAGGGIDGKIAVDVDDRDGDEKVRYSEIWPLKLFGEITASLRANAEASAFGFSKEWSWESPKVTIFSFESGGNSAPDLSEIIYPLGSTLTINPQQGEYRYFKLEENLVRVGSSGLTKEYNLNQFTEVEVLKIDDDIVIESAEILIPLKVTTGNGSDGVQGGLGNDSIETGSGADVIESRAGDDTIRAGDGDDLVYAGIGNDSVDAGSGGDIVEGGAGDDRIDGGEGSDNLRGDEGNDTINGGAGEDFVEGGKGNDSLLGGEDNDLLLGDAGEDTLSGGNGDDLLFGGADGDRLTGDAGDDSITGDEGDDFIEGNEGQDQINGNVGNDTILGGADGDRLLGERGDDSIQGNTGDDIISGGDDNDTITGNEDNDLLFGDAGDDSIEGNQGDDNIKGDIGNDRISGNEGNDLILGNEGDDILSGGANNDTILGGTDNDAIAGDSGNDRIQG